MKATAFIVISAFLLSACGGSASVKLSFPTPPPKLMDEPPTLKIIKTVPSDIKPGDIAASDVKISDVAKVVVDNYTTCNVTREQVLGLQSWIKEQAAINK